MFQRYYEEEMRALHEGGREFARLHPTQARYLHTDSLTDRDPHVERLFEGFAYLASRIRERLDDELPEYTEGLFRLLYPHYLRPIPALTIVEYLPKPGLVQKTTTLAAGSEVRSGPVGDEGAVCRFTTAFPVRLQPVRLADVRVEWPDQNHSVLHLRLELERGAEWSALDLSALRLFFGTDPAVASALRLFLARHVAGVTVRAGETARRLPAGAVRLVGFEEADGLLPYGPESFLGYRLLQEYFAFPAKFHFADLVGLGADWPKEARALDVEVRFDRAFPHDRPLRTEHVRLHCTPAVNLYEESAEPVRVEHRQSEYRVRASARHPRSVEVYGVASVVGLEDATGKRHDCAPFHSFDWAGGRYFQEVSRSGHGPARDTWVSVGGEAAVPGFETLSLNVRCTNGDLPHELLPENAITKPAPGATNLATFRNLTRPTRTLRPPLDEHAQFLWRLLAYLSLNRASIASAPALGALLSLHDWTGDPANRRRVAGLRDVTWGPKEAMHRGGIVRGAEVRIAVADDHFPDEGDLHLFGSVLSALLADYATLNSFVHLDLTARPSGRHFRWEPRVGSRPLL